MAFDPALDDLLGTLRAAGLRVDVEAELRLLRVLQTEPDLDRAGLRAVLAAIVVKSREERRVYEHAFADWETRQAFLVAAEGPETRALGAGRRPAREPASWARRHGGTIASLALALAVALAVFWIVAPVRGTVDPPRPRAADAAPPSPVPGPSPAPAGTPDPSIALLAKLELPVDFPSPIARIEVVRAPRLPAGLLADLVPPLALALTGTAVAVGLWLALRKRHHLPLADPLPTAPRPGLTRILPSAVTATPARRRAHLLGRRDEETLVWGIGQFVSDEPTRGLDIAASIVSTARAAGRPDFRFHRARHHREVWLWIDESVGATGEGSAAGLQRYAAELAAALEAAGLPVERAHFWGVPERLAGEHGEFAPSEVDERRDTAIVALLTDGRLLTRRLGSERDRVPLVALCRLLSRWPHLALVDFARGRHRIEAHLAAHGVPELTVLSPEELPAFLGGDLGAGGAGDPADAGDTRAWAAACALAPFPIDEETAFRLREHLGLRTSAWAIERLRAEARIIGARLDWPRRLRARHLAWLVDVDEKLLGRALEFWHDLLSNEAERRAARDAVEPWKDTPAERHLKMEQALLHLWDAPEPATEALYKLHQGDLGAEVERHLRGLAPRECAGTEAAVVLPWSLDERSARAKVMLLAMGLGRDAGYTRPERALDRPGRLYLAVAAAAGIAAWGLGGTVHRAMRSPPPAGAEGPVIVQEPASPPAGTHALAERQADGSYAIIAGTRRHEEIERGLRPGDRALIRWTQGRPQCREKLAPGVWRWRCGHLEEPPWPEATSWPDRSLFVLDAPEDDVAAHLLAARLLDSGSAHAVLLGPEAWRSIDRIDRHDPLGRPAGTSQIVILTPKAAPQLDGAPTALVLRVNDWWRLTTALRYGGVQPLRSVWPEPPVLRGTPDKALLAAGPDCPYAESIDERGMKFVRVCAGEFWMGSPEEDKEAGDDEKPMHRVALDEFWMGKYEVSNAEYGRAGEGADLPVTRVSWDEAQRFCESRGHRLPTEAEWEYAARGVEGRKYPWGDEPPDEKRAVFGGRAALEPEPITSHPDGQGPFGTFHQAGNVWEWVADEYQSDKYKSLVNKVTHNPLSPFPPAVMARVLRGGSFFHVQRRLHSTDRDGTPPDARFRAIGVRCVRGLRRQP